MASRQAPVLALLWAAQRLRFQQQGTLSVYSAQLRAYADKSDSDDSRAGGNLLTKIWR